MRALQNSNRLVVKINDKVFCEIIEKRIRKNIRLRYPFSKNDCILAADDLTAYLLNKILKDMPAKVYSRKTNIEQLLKKDKKTSEFIKKNRINKIVIPWTADDECCIFLKSVFSNKPKKKIPYVKFLLTATDDEIGKFAKINRIPWKPNKKDRKILQFIEELNKLYPQTKFSLLKSAIRIEEILSG